MQRPETKKDTSENSDWSSVIKDTTKIETGTDKRKDDVSTNRPSRMVLPPSVVKKQKRHLNHPMPSRTPRETESVNYGGSLFGDLQNEYDPAKPNDYEAVIQERARKKYEAELEAEKQERLLQQQAKEKAATEFQNASS